MVSVVFGGFNNPKQWLSGNGSAGISFVTPSYVPSLQFPFHNSSYNLNYKLGVELFGFFPDGYVNGSYSEQTLISDSESRPAYGYLHHNLTRASNHVLTDLNRFHDGAYIPRATPNLAVPQATYDIYTVAGQGVGGVFRPYQSAINSYFSPSVFNSSVGLGIGTGVGTDQSAEAGGGNLVHLGLNLSQNYSESSSGRWEKGNFLEKENLSASHPVLGHPDYEPAYFKQIGEKTWENDPGFISDMGKDKAVYVPVSRTHRAQNVLAYGDETETTSATAPRLYRNERAIRNQHMSYLTAEEASQYSLDKKLLSYKLPALDDILNISYPFTPETEIARTHTYRQDHHPSEFHVTQANGSVHVFGYPAYNTFQQSMTFDASELPQGPVGCDQPYLMTYTPGVDNIPGKKKDTDGKTKKS